MSKTIWLETSDVEFPHPCSVLSHPIALFFCGTHNFKNLRNALLNSIIDGCATSSNRCFVDIHDFSFGWQTIERQFLRDKRRIDHGYSKATRLNEKAVIPNKYDKMAVEPAKNVFPQKCITEHIINIAKRLGFSNTMIAIIPDSKERYNENQYISTENRLLHYMKQLKFLRSTSNYLLHLITNDNIPSRIVSEEDKIVHRVKDTLTYHDICEIKSDISSVEFLVVVSTMYVETFLNKEKQITKDNIHIIERTLQHALSLDGVTLNLPSDK